MLGGWQKAHAPPLTSSIKWSRSVSLNCASTSGVSFAIWATPSPADMNAGRSAALSAAIRSIASATETSPDFKIAISFSRSFSLYFASNCGVRIISFGKAASVCSHGLPFPAFRPPVAVNVRGETNLRWIPFFFGPTCVQPEWPQGRNPSQKEPPARRNP